MELGDLVSQFGKAPAPWVEGRTIPWDEPGFSRRMLASHLSQAHDGASRRAETIDRHVRFVHEGVLGGRPSRVLDLGCGPGLYAHRLAGLGHDCVGIDIGPASIEYAREQATARRLSCSFELGDIRDVPLGEGHDLVMLLYGELNLFPRDEAVTLLRRCAAALSGAGRLLLEVHSLEAARRLGQAPPKWSAVESGLFSEAPHLRLEESFWQEDTLLASGRYWIVDAAGCAVKRHGWTLQGYPPEGYEALLADAGLRLQGSHVNLDGGKEDTGFPVLLASVA